VVTCPDCEISLTHHKTEAIALCHYCDFSIPAPEVCPECGFSGIQYGGLGTQRLEAEVKARFRNIACLRMDTDTMRGRGSHEKALAAFREGKYRILLGTQMIAKGLDFPNVTLVGVINADTALHLPDFRAAERTFYLVTQVAGRTGRGERGGRVLVQTFSPDHPAIQAAADHDYERFVAGELPLREVLKYPPVGAMIRLVVRGPSEPITLGFAKTLAEQLKKMAEEMIAVEKETSETGTGTFCAKTSQSPFPFRVQGPAPAPFAKLRGNYRFQIQFQGLDRDLLRETVRRVTKKITPPDDVQWIADVDPLDML
jgi:primosomal protein N' (replication factor Y)